MQVLDDSWSDRAHQISEKRTEVTPPRAIIYDRNGLKIVGNKTYFNLMVVEGKMGADFDTIGFAKLIGWEPKMITERFVEIVKGEGTYYNKYSKKKESNYQKNRPYPFLKEITKEEMVRIAPFLDSYPGFYEEETSMRYYPYPNGANILGYLSEVNKEEVSKDKFYKPSYNIGRAGIERIYEKQLRGSKGVHYIVRSAMNNEVKRYENGRYDTLARPAEPIRLGLDMTLQAYGEALMKNKKGCIVAIEPKTGEILSMVSAPSYDPNILVGRKNVSQFYPELLNNPDKPLYPRPTQAEYPPGSIFKLVQSLIGLQEGVIQANTSFPCNKGLVGCHSHPSPSSVARAVKFSCNPYYYYAVKKIIEQKKYANRYEDAEDGLNLWNKYMQSFGLGKKLNSDVYGLRAGLIPNSAYYDKWYGHRSWAFSTIRSIAIGQGEVKLTPLHMANLAATIANKGWYYDPHFVQSPKKGFPIQIQKNQTMVDAKHFSPVIDGMWRVVNEAGGTAGLAKIDGIDVCGKTGTVENFIGSVKQKNHSVFIAFAPMDNPQIAIAVFVENAGFGGTWAAPIASLMIEKYLNKTISNPTKETRILDAVLNKN
ncbi:penicillin-binding transpeptidase domain-containing protein [Crocinitomicaceae bacterium]|nr:penicillin-binding transpeptidase domain-containing protein [Crocinitomicaceae bacterium]